MGDLWETAVATATGAAVVWMTARRVARWARGRCDQALNAAAALPPPRARNLALVRPGPGPAMSRQAAHRSVGGDPGPASRRH